MITKEEADGLENETPKELVDMLCTQSELIDLLKTQLKAKDEEIEKLKSIIEEAIRKPMGVEPHSWSDYKMLKDNA